MSAELDRRAFLGRAARFAAAGVAGHTLLGGATSVLSDGMLGSRHGVLGQGRAPAITLPGIRPLATRTPAIIPRAAWGADESRRRSRTVYHPVRKVVVHHTVTPNGDPDPVTQIRKIYDMHLARDGGRWSDIGYHYLIDQQGRIYEGRWARDYDRDEARTGEDPFGRLVQGSHAGEWNPGTLGIALMGNFVDGDPTPQALESLIDLIVWKCGVHGLSPDGQEPHLDDRGRLGTFPTIIGHSDVRVTECPGPRLKALIPRIRTQVARRLARSEDDGPAGGYWVLDQEGGVFAYGDAHFRGSLPALRAAGTSAGRGAAIAAGIRRDGYLVLDRDGGVFAFGKAKYHGSLPALRQQGAKTGQPVAIAATPNGDGYAVLDRDGGVFAFGDARYQGSVPGLRAAGHAVGDAAAVDIAFTRSGRGYWVLDRAGGVFPFGDAGFHGSVPGTGYQGASARRIVASPRGRGYLILCDDGAVLRFGDAPFLGHGPRVSVAGLAVAR